MIGKMKDVCKIFMICLLMPVALPSLAWAITPDIYEEDNSPYQAKLIIVDGHVQHHNFHNATDEDWILFEVSSDENLDREYEIKLTNPVNNCVSKIEVYDSPDAENALLTISKANDDGSMVGDVDFTADGCGYIKVTSNAFGNDTGYDLEVNPADSPDFDNARILGLVFENEEFADGVFTRVPIANVNIQIQRNGTEKIWHPKSSDGCNSAGTFCHPAFFGLYLTHRVLSTGTYIITANADGYAPYNNESVKIERTGQVLRHDIEMKPSSSQPTPQLFTFWIDRDKDGQGSNYPIPSEVHCKNCTKPDCNDPDKPYGECWADNDNDDDDDPSTTTIPTTTVPTTTVPTTTVPTTTVPTTTVPTTTVPTTTVPTTTVPTTTVPTTTVPTTTVPTTTVPTTTTISTTVITTTSTTTTIHPYDMDDDRDGYTENQGDCDDSAEASSINPGAEEAYNGIDDNCNGEIDEGCKVYFHDGDNDGHSVRIRSCKVPEGYKPGPPLADGEEEDCDDIDPNEHPGQHWFQDKDGDEFSSGMRKTACERPGSGYYLRWELKEVTGDCDDNESSVNPEAEEICNGIDDNCNDEVDECCKTYYRDQDGDGYGDPNNSVKACEPPEGYVENKEDCDDANASINPDAEEICNGVDDNCNGEVDECCKTYYRDQDEDGYGDPNDSVEACEPPEGYVENNADCDDTNRFINPDAQEIGNGKDDDCNGLVGDDVDKRPDDYEADNEINDATVITLNEGQAELLSEDQAVALSEGQMEHRHNFHGTGDEDWVKFYGIAGEIYTIEAINLAPRCDAVIQLYFKLDKSDIDGTPLASVNDGLAGEDEILEWLCLEDGIHYVRIAGHDLEIFGEGTGYDLLVSRGISSWATRVITGGSLARKPAGDTWVKTDRNDTAILSDGTFTLVSCADSRRLTVESDKGARDMLIMASGDFKADIRLDDPLHDAVAILQFLTGTTHFTLLPDPNRDGKIGLEDVLYILRESAVPTS